ncbi:MAG: hypothetical protein J0J06_16705 [Sphingomonas sp.]|uniref:hypothetical protein n=1 Tax=Sphingomonas sp. TaxID=28214 RepID=UPI001AC41CAA|nr:hypothetical protein [Sphingomonas sp.]MBN8817071.1 hypothetical protein [Sphingomonas sp.]
MIHDAYAFRGEFVDIFTHIERWAADVIRSDRAKASGLTKGKPSHFIGQKIELVRTLAADDAQVFVHPGRVRHLIDYLAPYLKLRSDVVHSTLRILRDNGEEFWAFESSSAEPASAAGRLWLKAGDAKMVLAKLRDCRRLLGDQRTKPVTG